MFDSVEAVIKDLDELGYICDKRIATVVFLAQQLDKPILIEGPAGVGKTELAKVVAKSLGRELIRLQCYEGLALHNADAIASNPCPFTGIVGDYPDLTSTQI